MALITLKDIVVEFPTHNASSLSLQSHLGLAVGGKFHFHNKIMVIRALQIENLKIYSGDRIGIIGHNGAGKTSLLRLLSGVYAPVSGKIQSIGRVSSFTDITLGMELEASGLDNIIFRLVFLGLTFKQARQLSPEIEKFSELGEYLNLPVRQYSAGMFLRLAFAISTAIKPDIIIMDEMISGGDAYFKQKAKKRLNEILDFAKILVIASHDKEIIQSLCNRVIWMDHGQIKMDGHPLDVYLAYDASVPQES